MTDKPKKTRAPGGGRKAADGVKPTRKFMLRVDDVQHAKLLRLGGAVFLRRKINEEVEK